MRMAAVPRDGVCARGLPVRDKAFRAPFFRTFLWAYKERYSGASLIQIGAPYIESRPKDTPEARLSGRLSGRRYDWPWICRTRGIATSTLGAVNKPSPGTPGPPPGKLFPFAAIRVQLPARKQGWGAIAVPVESDSFKASGKAYTW